MMLAWHACIYLIFVIMAEHNLGLLSANAVRLRVRRGRTAGACGAGVSIHSVEITYKDKGPLPRKSRHLTSAWSTAPFKL
ncbi:hypothetical protein BJ170DRAFT_125020 [Xylariales sp. AK1849]|nr:hypothetical protein BJ170DRAFT_125020 [Xylariales sp. AK1849]